MTCMSQELSAISYDGRLKWTSARLFLKASSPSTAICEGLLRELFHWLDLWKKAFCKELLRGFLHPQAIHIGNPTRLVAQSCA